MGKIVHVELKLYAEDNPDLEKEIMKELSRIFQKSPNLLISSIKSINIIKEIDVNFKESKFIQDKIIAIHKEIIGELKKVDKKQENLGEN